MEEPEDKNKGEKSEKQHEISGGDVPVEQTKSRGDVPKKADEKKVSTSEGHQLAAKSTKSPFSNTRRNMRSFRRGLKKFWDLWSGFTRTSGPVTAKKRKNRQTSGVPGFEEIACIEVDMPDIMMTDKDKIRTSCKQCMKNPPKFPTKEQVKSKLIAADKYYGVNRSTSKSGNMIEKSGSLEHDADYFDEDGKIIRPSWRFILERPLVEQYVLMTNYIRKISVLSELEGTQNELYIDEEDTGSDTEYEKFAEKHKIEMQNFFDSMRGPAKKDTGVQTSNKSSQILEEPASETSLYPDSGSSESMHSNRESSAITIITSHDLSSPQQSDFENRLGVRTRVKSAVRWWESKDPPQTSESFQTSCDSVREVAGTVSKMLSPMHNEPVEDTSGSGSDGKSIPVHSAAGKVTLFESEARKNNRDPGAKIESIDRSNLAQDTPMKHEKATATQKKVTFSPAVEYFNYPQKNNAIFSLPKQFNEGNKVERRQPVSETLQSLEETKNYVTNKTPVTLTPNQKQIVLQLGSSPKEVKRGFSVVQNNLSRDSPGVASTHLERLTTGAMVNQRTIQNMPKSVTNRKISSSTEYRPSPEIVDAISPLDYRSLPEPKSNQVSLTNEQDKDSKESSSNSSERIELKPSPAVFFRPGDASAITSLATDKFYPEVPDFDEVKEGTSYRQMMDRGGQRGSPVRVGAQEGHKLNSSATNQGFVKVVIVRGQSPDVENKANLITKNNQQPKKYNMNSIEICTRNESTRVQHRVSDRESSNGTETELQENYTKIVGHVQHHSNVGEIIASRNEQTSLYSNLLEDLYTVANTPLDAGYRNTTERHSNVQPREQHHVEERVSRSDQQRTVNHHVQQKANLSRGIQFSSVQATKDRSLQGTTESVKLLYEEGLWNSKREASHVHHQAPSTDAQEYNIMTTDDITKGPPRANNAVTSILSNSHQVLRKIPEEHDYSTTQMSLVDKRQSGVQLESQGKGWEKVSFEDFGRIDVLKMSQIYSSSSSFVTPSEERMNFGLHKVEATVFQPMVVEDITPEVTMMPSKTETCVSSDRITPLNSNTEEMEERVANKVLFQEQKREAHEIKYQTLTQIQYPTQFEILIPCYSLGGNVRYATQKEVDIRTDKATITDPQIDSIKDHDGVIESNIQLVLQKVHETIISRQTSGSGNGGKNEDAESAQKQWLMDVIPMVTSTKSSATRQYSANPNTHSGGGPSATPNTTEVKPVFKFLKRQQEMEKNNEF